MTRSPLFALCFAAFCAASAAHAGPAGLQDGTYDATSCTPQFSDTRFKVEGNNLSFFESFCTLSNPQSLRNVPGAILLDATCEGEGESWSSRFILMQTRDGGMTLLQEGWGDYYARCP